MKDYLALYSRLFSHFILTIALIFSCASAFAQNEYDPPYFVESVDRNGFDMTNGGFLRQVEFFSIGNPDKGGLTFSGIYHHRFELTDNESEARVRYWKLNHWGGRFDSFSGEFQSAYYWGTEAASYSTRFSVQTLQEAGYQGSQFAGFNRTAKPNNDAASTILIGTNAAERSAILMSDGRRVNFQNTRLQSIEFANGVVWTYHYASNSSRLKAVTTNAGYMLHFQYASGENRPSRVIGVNRSRYNCQPLATSCSTTQGGSWPYVDLVWQNQKKPSDDSIDANGRRGVLLSFRNALGHRTVTHPEWKSPQNPTVVDYRTTLAFPNGDNFARYTLEKNGQTWVYSYFHNRSVDSILFPSGQPSPTCRGSAIGPNGYQMSWECTKVENRFGLNQAQIREINNNGRITRCEPDCNFKPRRITNPNGVIEQFEYDNTANLTGDCFKSDKQTCPLTQARNVTKLTTISKTGFSLPSIVRQWRYPVDTPANRFDNFKRFNKPVAYIDGRSAQTDISYYPAHGGVNVVSQPSSGSGQFANIRPRTRNSYTKNNAGIYNLTTVSICARSSSCAGSSDEIITRYTYRFPQSQVSKITQVGRDGSSSIVTRNVYNDVGDLSRKDDSLSGGADTTHYYYDRERRLRATVLPDSDGSGGLSHQAIRTTYNKDGKVITTETGSVSSPSQWNSLSVLSRARKGYDGFGRLTSEVNDNVGGSISSITQYNYDALDRVNCTAIRMNPTRFSSLSSACAQSGAGQFGLDRISRNTYLPTGEITQITQGLGTPLLRTYRTNTYYPDGSLRTIKDAGNNLTTYRYDGFNRLSRVIFPSKTAKNSSNNLDYEGYGYDNNDNRTSQRKRDGRTLIYRYDRLNRMTRKTVPNFQSIDANFQTQNVFYDYDLRGRETTARFGSLAGRGITYSYDSFDRVKTTASNLTGRNYPLSYQYDTRSQRTRLTFPDNKFFGFTYNVSGRLKNIRPQNNTVATLEYNNGGQLTSVKRSNSTQTNFTYDAAFRPKSVQQNVGGKRHDLTQTFGYNPASQIISRSITNDRYLYRGDENIKGFYQTNGLNQYTSAGNKLFSYDANGNLTNDGIREYFYDSENRLIRVIEGSKFTYIYYDPKGRIYRVRGSETNDFIYDGDELVAEYNRSGKMLRRYVHGAGIDDPLVWYEGSSLENTSRFDLFKNRQGSVVAVTNSQGKALRVNKYDAFGIPSDKNIGRFSYTGQITLPETGLLYYKARVYSPHLGRFLQTDPIGYEDQTNLYAYVANDPYNNIDPNGEFIWHVVGAAIGAGANLTAQLISNGGNLSQVNISQVVVASAAGAVGVGLANVIATNVAKIGLTGASSVAANVAGNSAAGGFIGLEATLANAALDELDGDGGDISNIGESVKDGFKFGALGAVAGEGIVEVATKSTGKLLGNSGNLNGFGRALGDAGSNTVGNAGDLTNSIVEEVKEFLDD